MYTQFADAFVSIQQATNARYACTGLLECFHALSARASPVNVILVGHGLGGAYAVVGGPWAAVAFPKATVQVATAGAPAVVANNLFYVVWDVVWGGMRVFAPHTHTTYTLGVLYTHTHTSHTPLRSDVQHVGWHPLCVGQWEGPCAPLPRVHIRHAAGATRWHVYKQHTHGNAGVCGVRMSSV